MLEGSDEESLSFGPPCPPPELREESASGKATW